MSRTEWDEVRASGADLTPMTVDGALTAELPVAPGAPWPCRKPALRRFPPARLRKQIEALEAAAAASGELTRDNLLRVELEPLTDSLYGLAAYLRRVLGALESAVADIEAAGGRVDGAGNVTFKGPSGPAQTELRAAIEAFWHCRRAQNPKWGETVKPLIRAIGRDLFRSGYGEVAETEIRSKIQNIKKKNRSKRSKPRLRGG